MPGDEIARSLGDLTQKQYQRVRSISAGHGI